MTTRTNKNSTHYSGDQVLRTAYNEVDATLSTSGFLTGKVGNKITLTISTTSVADDTETYSYYDSSTLLYTIKIIYTGSSRSLMISSERIT